MNSNRTANELLDQRPPPRAEDLLACPLLVDRAAAVAEPPSELRIAGQAAHRRGERLRVARRDEQRALAVDEQLSRGAGVTGDQRRPTGERLVCLVGDHALGLVGGAEDPER